MARAVRNRFPLLKGRTGRRCLAILAMAGLVVAGVGLEAGANLPGSTFEGNDGNFAVNTPGNTDWAGLNAAQQAALAVGVDLPSGQTDNSFGNGTKESDNNVTVGLGSIPNSKADLGNFYLTSETVSVSGQDHVMMYLGWTRVNTSGTTNFDFEINQAAQPDLTTPGPKTLVRTGDGAGPGGDDILINYDFQGGAQTPTLAIRTWTGTDWSSATPIVAPVGEAEVNRVALANPLAQPPSPANAPAFTFGEAAIDLTAAGVIDPDECTGFSSAYVKSRASDAFTSAVKDFIAPQPINIDTCGSITIVKVTDPSPDASNTSFPFTLTGGPSALNESFSLLNGGSHTSDGLLPGSGYNAAEQTPAGWDLDSAVCDDGSPPDNISLSNNEDVTCTFTNVARANLHIVKVAERDGVDFSFVADPPLNPANFTLQNGGQQDYVNLVPGTYGVDEVVPDGWNLSDASCDNGDEPTAVTLAGGDDVTCTFTNVVERGAISIHKSAKHAAADGGVIDHAGVTFTVTNATNGFSASGQTDSNGNLCIPNAPVSLLDGDYTITETVPAGYTNPTPTQTYTVVESTCASALVASFQNTPLTNITVSVDSQIPGGTASTIDCTLASAATDPTTGDGSLTLSNLVPGTYSCTVVVDP
jgi:Prealbumin-like fold domain